MGQDGTEDCRKVAGRGLEPAGEWGDVPVWKIALPKVRAVLLMFIYFSSRRSTGTADRLKLASDPD